MRRLTTTMLLLVAALSLWTSCSKVPIECEDTCDALDRCGLLPSLLGGGDDPVDNCSARCELSDEALRKSIQGCVALRAPTHFPAANWCTGSSPCANIASCLEGLGGDELLGQAAVQIVATRGYRARYPDVCETADTGLIRPMSLSVAAEICAANDAASAIAFVTQGGVQIQSPAVPCAEFLVQIIRLEGLTPGPAVPGIIITGARTTNRSGVAVARDASQVTVVHDPGNTTLTPFCNVFYGPEIILVAGEVHHVKVDVPGESELAPHGPTPFECESTAAACKDGADNDGDGQRDCADPDCLPFCQLTEAQCADGLDDDEDGVIDCQDPDCAQSPSCAAGGDAGP